MGRVSKVDDIGEGGKAKSGAKLRRRRGPHLGGASSENLRALAHSLSGSHNPSLCVIPLTLSRKLLSPLSVSGQRSLQCVRMTLGKQGTGPGPWNMGGTDRPRAQLWFQSGVPLGHHVSLPALLHEVGRTRAASTVDCSWKAATALFGKAVPQRGAERARIRADGYKTDDHREGSDLARRSPW